MGRCPAVDGHDVTGARAYLYDALVGVKPGTTVSITVERGDTIKLVAAEK